MSKNSPLDGLGARLAWTRRLAGDLPAYELAILLGGSPSLVSMIERGDTSDPRGTSLAALALALGVSLDWLVLGSGPEPTSEQVKTAVAQARARRAQTPDSPALAATGS